MTPTRDVGLAVEQRVVEHLENAGLTVVARNVLKAGAELDIVAKTIDRGDELYVFVEVRYRADDRHGLPEETVGREKQRRVIRGATGWLVSKGLWEKVAVRFDVVGVTGGKLRWYKNAFEAF